MYMFWKFLTPLYKREVLIFIFIKDNILISMGGILGIIGGIILMLIGIFLIFIFPSTTEHQTEQFSIMGIVIGIVFFFVGLFLIFF